MTRLNPVLFLALAAIVFPSLLWPAAAAAQIGVLAVGSDRIAYGQSVTVAAGDEVHDAISFGGSVTIEPGAIVTGDVVAMGGSISVREGVEVHGDVVSLGGSVSVGPGVSVAGDVSALGGSVDVDPSAEILGSRVGSSHRRHHGSTKIEKTIILGGGGSGIGDDDYESESFLGGIVWITAWFLAVLVLAFVIIVASPKRVDRMRRPLHDSPGKAFASGLLLHLGIGVVLLLLLLTFVGVLLWPVVFLAWLCLAILGWTVISLRVGRRFSPPGKRTPARELLIGMLVFFGFGLLTQVPVISLAAYFVLFIATVAGTGAVVLTRFGERRVDPAAELWPPPEDFPPTPPA